MEAPANIAISHTTNGDGGYNYLAIITGYGDPEASVKFQTQDGVERDS